MAVLPIQLSAPTFPDGYCPPTLQQFANDLQSGTQLSSPVTLDTVVISDTPPADTTKLWFKTVSSLPFTYPGTPLYYWAPGLGVWVARHPQDPGTHRWEEFANAAQIDTYEGGTAVPVTDTAGPFWEIDPNYVGRSPMSPGAISGSDPAKSLGYGEDYGDGSHELTAAELAAHTHGPFDATSDAFLGHATGGVGGTFNVGAGIDTTQMATTGSTGDGDKFSVVHPVRGMSCIRRSQRLFYLG